MANGGQLTGTAELMVNPQVSVIIPTHNRPGPLAAFLQALSEQDFPSDRFEVVVVDDGSDTPLEASIAPFRTKLDIMLLSQASAGPAAARNAGAAQARGEFLAFTDDDCTPAVDWLSALEARLETAPTSAIGGPSVNALTHNPQAVVSQWILEWMYRCYNADLAQARFLASNNLALPAAGFAAVGGFDHTHFPLAAGEDRDFCERWRQHGMGLVFAPEVIVRHAPELNARDFWRQHVRRGRGAAAFYRVSQRRPWRPARSDLDFQLKWPLWACQRLWQTGGRRALRLAGLLALWRVAQATGYVQEAMGRRTARGSGVDMG